MDTYKPRIADSVLARKLAGKGAVLIEGPPFRYGPVRLGKDAPDGAL